MKKETLVLKRQMIKNKVEIRKFIKDKRNKNKQKETLEKVWILNKHLKIQQNLKVLNKYIK